jgi:tyrosinase
VDPESSPIFDGSDTSVSGNGEKIPHNDTRHAPAGNGGGCVKSGPFKDFVVNLGPVSPDVDPSSPKNPRGDGFGYNPRCLRRDISNQLTSRYARTEDIVRLITMNDNILQFQNQMQSVNPANIHSAGHYTINGDPGSDFYVSPGDPAFWLHHGMIDRVWAIWQNQNITYRLMAMEGGTNMIVTPEDPGRKQTLDDLVDLGVVAPNVRKIRDLMSTVDGPFCYLYE